MKKVIFMLLPAFVSLLCSCGFNNNDNAGLKSGAVTIDSFLEVTKADFATELKKSNKAVFYESMITFANTVDEDPGNIERVTNIVQDTSMCIQFVHQGGNTYITKNPSWWLKGLPINLDSIISTSNESFCWRNNRHYCKVNKLFICVCCFRPSTCNPYL